MPSVYYKYIPAKILDLIIGGTIRFTQPSAFNDPFEMPVFRAYREMSDSLLGRLTETTASTLATLTGVSATTSGLHRFPMPLASGSSAMPMPPFLSWSMPTEHVKSEQERIIDTAAKVKEIDENFVALSLTRTKTNLLMWAHYADEHRGAVVGIDIDHDGFRRPDDIVDRINYVGYRMPIEADEKALLKHFFIKSRDWDYEQEFRIVRRLNGKPKDGDDARSQPLYLFPVPPGAIRSITFGARVQAAGGNAIKARLDENIAFGHVVCERAVVSGEHFGIDFSEGF